MATYMNTTGVGRLPCWIRATWSSLVSQCLPSICSHWRHRTLAFQSRSRDRVPRIMSFQNTDSFFSGQIFLHFVSRTFLPGCGVSGLCHPGFSLEGVTFAVLSIRTLGTPGLCLPREQCCVLECTKSVDKLEGYT